MQTPLHLLRVTLQSVRDAVVTTDHSARVQTLNLAAEAMTGWSEAESLGKPIEEVIELREPISDGVLVNPAYTALDDGTRIERQGQTLLVGRGGRRIAVEISATPYKDAQGAALGCVIVFHDVSEAVQLAERMAYQSQHDTLTGLPNRILLVDRVEQATKMADRNSDQLAVLFLNVDVTSQALTNEKSFVPPQPTPRTDLFTKEVAARLTATLRESDTVTRLGSNEFVVLLPGVKAVQDVEVLSSKLLVELTLPYDLAELEYVTQCSIGISLYPEDASDADTLMRLAEGAMQKASRISPNSFAFAKQLVDGPKLPSFTTPEQVPHN